MFADYEIKTLIKELYGQIGGNTEEVLPMVSIDSGLSYHVGKQGGKTVSVFRRHIEDKNYPEIKEALRGLL